MKILAIETSCDETACAIVSDGIKILSSVVASSTEMHKKYGGIVPEVAAREQLKCIIPTILEALAQAKMEYKDIDQLAVTIGPGLIGSLLVGVETAKTISFVLKKPIIPVNHVIAHMYANLIQDDTRADRRINFPAISLVVSGGHSELYLMNSEKKLQWLGGTVDDAAGEAFDKTARLLGFGTGGGVAIQKAAKKNNGQPIKDIESLPRPMLHDNSYNFSFSGLKTAIVRLKQKLQEANTLNENVVSQLAYETQEAITDVLVEKTFRAVKQFNAKSILLSGGVAANLRLREKFSEKLPSPDTQLFAPDISLCTDNAVYIASYAHFQGQPQDWRTIEATPDLSVEI